eukprot:CAMPEP_0170133928 /NCGR_PEP_ID=MMETSP0033_2-20121228/1611_1 /TAXON_ID=195969 /ORGANISM="Dolichomastix tenuilepis, Strain CCMP3274" /LENGTH=645 /DNA_ID=CAMNT_0010369463 /DNA_START=48 /DNA_END=1981 /DNA_ORIENTATION=+
MAKGKGGKAEKKRLEAEAAAKAAAEAAAKLEEERLKIEEEERLAREAEDARLKAEEEERLAGEASALQAELAEFTEFHANRGAVLAKADAEVHKQVSWERYLSCNPRPDPSMENEMNSYESSSLEREDGDLERVLEHVMDNESIIAEASSYLADAVAAKNAEAAEALKAYILRMRALSQAKLDRTTAAILQTADEYANSKGEVQLTGAKLPTIKYGLWVNHAKNPRFKSIEMPELSLVAELPKSLALASIAVRLTHVDFDEFSDKCTNEYKAFGGVFTVDLLALPPAAKRVKGWTLRLITPLASAVAKLPYPIPPAGSDMSAPPAPGSGAAAPPPMGLSVALPASLVVSDAAPRVGYWDADEQAWKTDGISEVKVEDGVLSFTTIKLTTLALLQSRVLFLPYSSWTLRPQIEDGTVTLRAVTAHNELAVDLEIGSGWARLKEPYYAQLDHLYKEKLAPKVLLQQLSKSGLHLMPEDRDAPFINVEPKTPELEEFACADVALLSTNFLIASSKWNAEQGKDDVIVRVSEVTDFDRTLQMDADKIFAKERENVHCLLYKAKGCVLVEAKDSLEKLDPVLELHMADGRDKTGAAAVRARTEAGVQPMLWHACQLVTMKELMQESTVNAVYSADPLLTDAVRQVMLAMR